MKHNFKRLLSLALVLMLVVSLLPVSNIAAEVVYTDVADEAALLAAIAEGKNPKLTASFELSASTTIAADTNITLDLNGQTLDVLAYQLVIEGTLTILDSSTEKAGTIKATSTGTARCIETKEGSTLNIKGGTIDMDSEKASYGVGVKGTVTIENAAITSNSTGSNAFCFYMTGGNLTINAGSNLSATSSSASQSANVIYCNNGNITINGGTLYSENTKSATSYGVQLVSGADKLTINGGSVTAVNKVGKSPRAIDAASGTVVINDGTFTATQTGTHSSAGNASALYNRGSATTTVKGGTFTSSGAKHGAYAVYTESSKTLNIEGGTFTADTSASSPAAYALYIIGGKSATVTGGTFTANSGTGNAFGMYALIASTTTAGESSVTVDSTSPATLTIPATAKAVTVNATSASSNAYGIYNEGITKLDSDKLTVTASSGYTGTGSSSLKYVYGIINQNQLDMSAGTILAQTSDAKATRLQAFGLNNSAKTSKLKDTAGTEHTVTISKGVSNITGGSLTGTTTKATAAGVMTNNGTEVNISGGTITGTTYAAWCYKVPINISGGTLNSGGNYVVRVGDGGGVCTVTGGTFLHSSKNYFTIGTGTLNLQGGTFVGEVGRGAVDITHMLDSEKYLQDYNGTVKEGKDTPKFEVTANGETKQYITYWDAVAAVNADTTGNAKVKLLKDIYLGLASAFTTSVEVDLNGKTWLQSNGTAIDVTAAGTENDVTRVVNGTIINDNASVVIYVRAGGIQIDGVTAFGQTTMPVCYTAPSYAHTENNYVKNSNLITNRFYTFSYRTQTAAQTDLDVLFENTNLINLYTKANGGEIFFAGWGDTTGQYTIGEGVNMYTVYNSNTLQRQNTTQKDNKGNLIIMDAGEEVVKAVAAEGCTIHDKQAAASYPEINSILASVDQHLTTHISTTPSLYLWSTDHNYVDGTCSCGATDNRPAATIGTQTFQSAEAALEAATEGQVVVLHKPINDAKADLLVFEGVTLDLNGQNVTASTLTSYGTLTDGQDGGKALIKTKNMLIAGEDSYLPIYDSANGGYRIYNYQVADLGSKKVNDNTAKFGFRLTLRNASGYALMANANSGLSMKVQIACDGASTFEFAYPIQDTTVQKYAQAMAAGKTTTAITLTVTGLDVLGANGSITMTPVFSTGIGMSAAGTGASWSATNN